MLRSSLSSLSLCTLRRTSFLLLLLFFFNAEIPSECTDRQSPGYSMANKTNSRVTEFILAGFTDHPELHVTLFLLFLVIYVFTLVGNLGMTILIWSYSQFYTPMYIFISNLSLVDLGYSSSIAPRVLISFSRESKAISYAGCVTQLYFFAAFATTESFLLAVMAYDR